MIDLGMPMDYGQPMAASSPSKLDEKVIYPSTYIDSKEELDIPESGEITFKFKRTKRSEEERDGGEEKYCYNLDLLAVVSVKKSSEKASPESAMGDSYAKRSAILDKIAEALEGDEDEDEEKD